MDVATESLLNERVGVRDLKNRLSHYLAVVKEGGEVIVTEHGRPVARLVPMAERRDRLAELVAAGEATPPRSRRRSVSEELVKAKGSVSELIAEQRR
jgi:prevent-host-death family protein